ncbi:MAG: hypothetical protein J7641_18565 [Cyanobacteria bacterium SID2]|nr:hypothetical protein [Cyanobacteria bacterium SID2]MBP0002205.1 hypothetical protein [Cyanobacteria bacterium SBC]
MQTIDYQYNVLEVRSRSKRSFPTQPIVFPRLETTIHRLPSACVIHLSRRLCCVLDTSPMPVELEAMGTGCLP